MFLDSGLFLFKYTVNENLMFHPLTIIIIMSISILLTIPIIAILFVNTQFLTKSLFSCKTISIMKNICKLVAKDSDPVEGTNDFEVEELEDFGTASSVDEIISGDTPYGKWEKPIITYGIKNNRAHLTDGQVRKAVNWSLTAFDFLIENELKFTTDWAHADFSYEFRATNEDPDLTSATLAYAGYPSAPENYRKIIVINTDFPWTPNGNPIPGRELEKMGFRAQNPDFLYKTWDLDQVLRHENGHKLGLPHSPNDQRLMSSNYGVMNEWIDEETEARILAKYNKRHLTSEDLVRLIAISRRRTETY